MPEPTDDAIGVRRVPPAPGSTRGKLICRMCGHTWDTTPEEDVLLAHVFAHKAEHLHHTTGSAPSSVTPDISTR